MTMVAAAIYGTLTEAGLPAGEVRLWFASIRPELGDLSPNELLELRLPGGGQRVLELARGDVAALAHDTVPPRARDTADGRWST